MKYRREENEINNVIILNKNEYFPFQNVYVCGVIISYIYNINIYTFIDVFFLFLSLFFLF